MTEIIHNFNHKSVLLDECIKGLDIKPNGVYVDGTLGGGGHASAIAAKLGKDGRLIGIDRDGTAIAVATERLNAFKSQFTPVRDTHENIRQVMNDLSVFSVDGFLLDLGVSSHQLDVPERGFSYRYDAPLDMRMDNRAAITAYDIVNSYDENELVSIIKKYGEERYAKRIAKGICAKRKNSPVETTAQLADIIKNSVPFTPPSAGHPAMRTFQAIRIVVNDELTGLAKTIEDMANLLAPGGRICIITFHSLEDRIVKQTFKYWADPCTCPKSIPYCVCGVTPKLSLVTRKPIRPSEEELKENTRAHSAKLRIAVASASLS